MTWPLVDFGSAPPYTQILDYQGGTQVIYIGWSNPGSSTSDPVWKIRKLTYDVNNNTTNIQWMNGSVKFNQIWDNRVSLNGVATNYS